MSSNILINYNSNTNRRITALYVHEFRRASKVCQSVKPKNGLTGSAIRGLQRSAAVPWLPPFSPVLSVSMIRFLAQPAARVPDGLGWMCCDPSLLFLAEASPSRDIRDIIETTTSPIESLLQTATSTIINSFFLICNLREVPPYLLSRATSIGLPLGRPRLPLAALRVPSPTWTSLNPDTFRLPHDQIN